MYNKEKSIQSTLKSVCEQSYPHFEIIVVDDGSKDNSLQAAQAIKDARLRVIHKENGGVSSARNRGIKEAKGDFIALLDGDDIWATNYLEEQVKLIDDFPKAAMWGVNYALVKGKYMWPCNQGMGESFRGYVENYFGTSHSDLYCSSSVVIRREVFDKVGYFDERIGSSEDLDMWYRIIFNYPVVYYERVLAYYNQNAENRVAYDTGTRFPLTKDIKYYFEKFLPDCEKDPVFSHFINNYVAANLLKDRYYFGTKQEQIDSDVVVKKLRYQDIHPKYRWIFLTPRWFGKIVYKVVCMKKSIAD